jgi:putative CocE/NonD family hydrolase
MLSLFRSVLRSYERRLTLPTTDQFTIQTRDDVELATTVYLPDQDGAYPAILLRTPYGDGGEEALAEYFVGRGFGTVVQQVRGTGESGGTFTPVSQERADAVDTVEWLLEQPWLDSDAGIGVFGMSYLLPASISAVTAFEAVSAVVNISGFLDLYAVTHRDGLGKSHHMLPWTMSRTHPVVDRSTVDWETAFRETPPPEKARAAGYPNDLWTEWCSLSASSQRRDQWSLWDLVSEVETPILHVTGWYDLCRGCTVSVYDRLSEGSNAPQRLLVGPWHHHNLFGSDTDLNGVDFGEQSRIDLLDTVGTWFDRWLDTEKSSVDELAQTSRATPVSVFVTGVNQWVSFERWPPQQTTGWELQLTADGALTESAQTAGTASFPVDPTDPVPTAGGPVFKFEPLDLESGPADRQHLHARSDVRLFTSHPLDEARTVAGVVECELALGAERMPCSVYVKLLEVSPEGTARVIADGVSQLLEGDAASVTIDCWSVAHEFAAGHRVGLELSGSDFPRFIRVPASGAPFEVSLESGPGVDSSIRLPLL